MASLKEDAATPLVEVATCKALEILVLSAEEDANDRAAKAGLLLGTKESAEAIKAKAARRDEDTLILVGWS